MEPTKAQIKEIQKEKFAARLDEYKSNRKKVKAFESNAMGKAKIWFAATYQDFTQHKVDWNSIEIIEDWVVYKSQWLGTLRFPVDFLWDPDIMTQKRKELAERKAFLKSLEENKERKMYEKLKLKFG